MHLMVSIFLSLWIIIITLMLIERARHAVTYMLILSRDAIRQIGGSLQVWCLSLLNNQVLSSNLQSDMEHQGMDMLILHKQRVPILLQR